MKSRKSKIPVLIVVILIAAFLLYVFLPKPVDVDVGTVQRGTLRVTVDEDGMTRVKDRYVVSSPVSGRLLRIELEPGDPVHTGKTIVATIEPGDPQLLDPRARAEAEARVKTADAARDQARTQLDRIQETHDFARAEFQRAQRLMENQLISAQQYDALEHDAKAAADDLRSAQFALKVAEFELEQARAALLYVSPSSQESGDGLTQGDDGRMIIRSPIDGRVLKRYRESSAVIGAGEPLLEVGDPQNLEIIIDVLSTDAVKIAPGTKVMIEHWGGERPLQAQVRLVEPAAFTKISVLGVEEQRVWVVADFENPPAQRLTLGDAYRLEARIVVWENENVLRVPSSALFRGQEGWMVFAVRKGRAHLIKVEIGHNNGLEAEVLAGLREDEQVVLYPSDQVEEGVAVDTSLLEP